MRDKVVDEWLHETEDGSVLVKKDGGKGKGHPIRLVDSSSRAMSTVGKQGGRSSSYRPFALHVQAAHARGEAEVGLSTIKVSLSELVLSDKYSA